MQTREYRNTKAGNCTPHFLSFEFCVFPCRTITGIWMLMEKLQKSGIHVCLCLVSEHLWRGKAVTGMLHWAMHSWTSCACRLSDLFQTMSGWKRIIHGEIGSFLKTTALVLFKTCLFLLVWLLWDCIIHISPLNSLISPFCTFVSYLYSKMWNNIVTHLNVQCIF